MVTCYELCVVEFTCFDNDIAALIPEAWANEGLAILSENMVMANLVHRDFSNDVASFGDTVNTRRPGEFSIKRKSAADSIQLQDIVSTNVQVKLDQHVYTSFIVKDEEATKSFQELVQIYLAPAMLNQARAVDRALLGRAHAFLGNAVGRLGSLDAATADSAVLEVRKRMNDNNAYTTGRNLVLGSSSESAILQSTTFSRNDARGASGVTALEEARLGRIRGFDTWMSQNVSEVAETSTEVAAGTTGAAYARGATGSLTIGVTGYVTKVGEYVTLAGDNQPCTVTATSNSSGSTTAITLDAPLKYAVANGAVATVYKAHTAKGAYAAGYSKGIVLDGHATPAQVGQLIAVGTGASRVIYTVIEVTNGSGEYEVHLDRPLVAAIADNQLVFPGPAGALNLAFHRDAIALVSRPLALPMSGNVSAAMVSANNVGMRVTMAYDPYKQGTVVTMDMLMGVAILEPKLGAVLLG